MPHELNFKTLKRLFRDQIEEGLCDLDVGLEIPFGVGDKMERLFVI